MGRDSTTGGRGMILIKITTKKIFLMPWTGLWVLVWNCAEWAGIPLGNLAPFVFSQAMGASSGKIVNTEKPEGGE